MIDGLVPYNNYKFEIGKMFRLILWLNTYILVIIYWLSSTGGNEFPAVRREVMFCFYNIFNVSVGFA